MSQQLNGVVTRQGQITGNCKQGLICMEKQIHYQADIQQIIRCRLSLARLLFCSECFTYTKTTGRSGPLFFVCFWSKSEFCYAHMYPIICPCKSWNMLRLAFIINLQPSEVFVIQFLIMFDGFLSHVRHDTWHDTHCHTEQRACRIMINSQINTTLSPE